MDKAEKSSDVPREERPNRPIPVPQIDEELFTAYTNAIFLSPAVLDMKIVFGETAILGQGTVDWHSSITMTWQQAKILQYYLTVIIAAHEMDNGLIKIPRAMLPKGTPPLPDQGSVKPELLKYLKFLEEYRRKFLEEQTA